jgi:pimeloyl-ACP methyl ester carboxylesterase
MEFMADAVHEVLEKEGVDNFTAVGFSMGLMVWAKYHQKYAGQIKAMVNLDGTFMPWPEEDSARTQYLAWRDGFSTQMLGWDAAAKGQMAGAMIPESAPQDLKEWGNYFKEYPNDLASRIWLQATAEEANKPVNWSVPLLCIYAEKPDSTMLTVYFPEAKVAVFEESGHVVHWEKADEVNALIEDWAL